MSTLPLEFHILDTETASLQGPPCEIAYLHVNENLDILSEFRTLVNPERPIEPGAQAIHGISDLDVANAPTMNEIAEHFAGPIFLVAHNAQFDARMIKSHVSITDQLCSLKLARQHIKSTTNHKLETLQAELGLPKRDSHSALGDVHTVRDFLLYLRNVTNMTLAQLIDSDKQTRLVHKMPFGQHKGRPLNVLSASYRSWLLDQSDIDPNLRYSLQQLKGL